MIALETGIQLHIRHWAGEKSPFVLLHGLASNCRLWEMVACHLAAEGNEVVTVDQRGHGLSNKPDQGYDFATITADLAALIKALKLDAPYIAGQSWGGNVVLEFGTRYPGRACGLAFIDGGFLDLQMRPDADWATTSERLRPPPLTGTPLTEIRERIRHHNPDWSAEGVEAVLANFEILPDQTVRPWLTVENHMQILRALWEQRPGTLYPQVQEPVLICVALDDNPEWEAVKRQQVAVAEDALAKVAVHWFEQTHHDIHVHRPADLAALLHSAVSTDP